MSLNNQFRTAPRRAKARFIIEAVFIFFMFSALLLGFFCHKTIKTSLQQKETPVKTHDPAKALASNRADVCTDSCDEIPAAVISQSRMKAKKTITKPLAVKVTANYFVEPPLPCYDVVEAKETVSASLGKVITSTNNSQIIIPPNAFVDGNGNVVTGNVDVKYREFHDYADILLSGIPMKYDSAGEQQLESAGMIEITASLENTPLYVNTNSKINVLLASMDHSPDYNLYYFDKQQNKWIYKGKDNVTSSMDGTGRSTSYVAKDSVKKIFTFNPKKYYIRIVSNGFIMPARKSIFSRKKEVSKFTFHVARSMRSLPELNTLSSVQWKYAGYDAMDVYKQVFKTDALTSRLSATWMWKNVTIDALPGNLYMFSMYGEMDTLQMVVAPALRTERSQRKFKQKFEQYLAARQNTMDAEKVELVKFQKDTAAYYAANGRFIPAGWGEQVAAIAQFKVVRQFEIDGFGIWNCDQPKQYPKGANVNAKFTDVKGKSLTPQTVYLIDKSKNTVYTYSMAELKNFKYNPSSDNLICVVLSESEIGVIKPKEIHDNYKQVSGRCIFAISERKIVNSQEEVRSLLAFN